MKIITKRVNCRVVHLQGKWRVVVCFDYRLLNLLLVRRNTIYISNGFIWRSIPGYGLGVSINGTKGDWSVAFGRDSIVGAFYLLIL